MKGRIIKHKDTAMTVGSIALGQILADRVEPLLQGIEFVKNNPVVGQGIMAVAGGYMAAKAKEGNMKNIALGFASRPVVKFVNANIFKTGVADELYDDVSDDLSAELYDDVSDDLSDELYDDVSDDVSADMSGDMNDDL